MPIYTEWENYERTIIRIHIHEPWDMNEYFEASLSTQKMMESVRYPVHLIVDATEMTNFPRNMLASIPSIHNHILPNQGLVIGVKFSPYLRAVLGAAVRVFPRFGHNLHFAQTLNDAHGLICDCESHPITISIQ